VILIVDFTCMREESHSWDSLVKFQEEIQALHVTPTFICIPRSVVFDQKKNSYLKFLEINPFIDLLSGNSNVMNIFQFTKRTTKIFFEIGRLLRDQEVKKLVWVNADTSSLLACNLYSFLYRNTTYHLRFIGWPEFWAPFNSRLLKLLVKIADKRKNIHLAFETSSLKTFLGSSGTVVPYPLSQSRENENKKCHIFLVGSARQEKGFDQMPTFAESLAKHLPEYKLILQQSTTPWVGYSNTLERLNRLENVVVLPAFLEREDLDSVLHSTAITILPYEPSSYKLRGSAALFESVENNIPVVAYSGVGFASDIERFHLGLVALSQNDLLRCVRQLTSSSVKAMGFEPYRNYSIFQLKIWINYLK